MKKNLYSHQQKFLNENPDKALICYGAGTGKTLSALLWLKDKTNIVIICPKSIKQKWQGDIKQEKITADIFTKEEFKKIDLSIYETMVFDEVQYANSPAFTKQRSQITTKVYNWCKTGKYFLGLTATPISSQPWNIHTLLLFSGKYIDWKLFREKFYVLESPRYMKGRYIYVPIQEWRKKARDLVLKYTYTATMEEIVGFIPQQYYEIINIKIPKKTKEIIDYQKENPELDSDIAIWYAQHQLEQTKEKIIKIKELSGDHSKVVIFAKYKKQIIEIEKSLKSIRQVYVMTGETKDQGRIIKQAQEDTECFFIIQADIADGYELSDFTCVIYASQSWRKTSDIQSQARVQRINNLKSNWYYWLLSGEKDKLVYRTIKKGNDFII